VRALVELDQRGADGGIGDVALGVERRQRRACRAVLAGVLQRVEQLPGQRQMRRAERQRAVRGCGVGIGQRVQERLALRHHAHLADGHQARGGVAHLAGAVALGA
jgi:hypothetical protein